MSLEINLSKNDTGVVVATLEGPVDSATYDILEKKAAQILVMLPSAVVFDMSGVNYVSSMGIGAILKAKKAFEQNKASFVMVNLQPQVKTVFDIIKALPAQAMFTSIAEADAYLSSIQRKEIEKGKQF